MLLLAGINLAPLVYELASRATRLHVPAATLGGPLAVFALTAVSLMIAVHSSPTSSSARSASPRRCSAHGAGARVVLASRRHQDDLALAQTLRDAVAIRCDVRKESDRTALVAAALDHFGGIDILVNSAGIASSAPAEDETPQQLTDIVETNLTAVFALTQLVGRHMLQRRSGVIVNIASPSAAISLDRYPLAAYAASKAGVVALTRELAWQWGRRGIRVNAIAPSFFPSATSGWLRDPDQVAWIGVNTALGRIPRAEELDGPLLFLTSDASSYVTGQTLYIDGGWNCR